ncbi:unnamed protein product [Cylindrotheca closterium]|uniref:WD repeat-containing protein 75 second beta-propeller domain-containing protein n=1 Tax=Cylindrotheca closterium TaxID=2856 RepID=A0AAD2FJZ4_9STRA|nr:unnamed protein product [Cylindrotheca closterium]
MKGYTIGGPLLGDRHQLHENDLVSWKYFEPTISPMIPLEKNKKQRFILLPHQHYISVLAYNTGAIIAYLVPQLENRFEDDDVRIESVCLVKQAKNAKVRMQNILDEMDEDESEDDDAESRQESSEEFIVMAGCSDGTIREFNLANLGALQNSGAVKCGRYHINGPCCYARRVIHVTKKEPIIQIASPATCNHQHGILAYVVSRTKNLEQAELEDTNAVSNVNVAVLRVVIPHFDGTASVSLVSKTADDIQRKKHIDSIKCRVGRDKTNKFLNTTPFRLLAVSREKPNKGTSMDAVFVVLARANTIHIYYEQLHSDKRFSPISLPMSATNPLSSISVAKNNTDIACGHMKGQIKILNDVLNNLESHNLALAETDNLIRPDGTPMASKPTDPRKQLITSKVHWHAHPVTSITYSANSSPVDPILYSGGEESVLVTWQPSRGTDKPVDMLPRLAMGGIVHVVCAHSIDSDPANGILVYCEDNSLQLFESHSKGKKWKLQGLACKKMDEDARCPIIEVDPRGSGSQDAPIVIAGLPEAPGFMQWYDSSKQKLLGSLEVAPFNRVSRTESDESSLPVPSVTSHAFSDNGNDLITLEESMTENEYVGAHDSDGTNNHGIVSTIRFWSWNNASTSTQAQLPYTLRAAMTYPHGPKNRVSALAIAKTGLVACTVSNDEKAFRIWNRAKSERGSAEPASWTCRYKVTIPAGFSNFETMKGGVAFSEDGSVLALSFGGMVTLWESEEARYLTTIRHLDDINNSSIDLVQFVSFGGLHDLLLVKSPSGVSLQSPFPQNASFTGWCWGIPAEAKGISVKDAALAASANCLAVALFDSNKQQSRIVLIDAASGNAGIKTESMHNVKLIGKIDGCIMSLCSTSAEPSAWDNAASTKTLDFFALTSRGTLLKFTDAVSESATTTLVHAAGRTESGGPRLGIERGDLKRERLGYYGLMSDASEKRKTAAEMFGITTLDDGTTVRPLTSDLPTLDDDFVSAFLRRNLR